MKPSYKRRNHVWFRNAGTYYYPGHRYSGFRSGRISEIGGAIGKGIKSFKKTVNDTDEIDVTPSSKDEKDNKKEEPK